MRSSTFISLLLALVLASGVAITGCGQEIEEPNTPANTLPKSASVEVYNEAFHPPTVTIAAGGTITWKNRANDEYSVNCDGLFQEILPSGQTYSHAFPTAGEFRVYDNVQSGAAEMRVIVK